VVNIVAGSVLVVVLAAAKVTLSIKLGKTKHKQRQFRNCVESIV